MTNNEFKRRRTQLMRMMGPGSIAILPSAPMVRRNRDAYYRYRQDSDFLYLTGFPEPNAVVVLIPGRKQAEYVLSVGRKILRRRYGMAPAMVRRVPRRYSLPKTRFR